jgi:uncharacterized membrane protein YphA (DoxX/SURF4 family)
MSAARDHGMVRFAQGLFALASASLAILMLAYGDFAPGGAALPAWIPWREIWIHACAVALLAASVAVCFPRTALTGVWVVGIYELIWVLISAPVILSAPLTIGAWYPFCESLTALVGAWILYVMLRWPSLSPQMPAAALRTVRAGQVLFGLNCVFYGASHFAYADYTASMVPAWLPGRSGFAYLTGLCHIAAGIGIITGVLARLAANLEAIMMSLFGLLVWVPTFFAQSPPKWATPPQNRWSELVVNLVLVFISCANCGPRFTIIQGLPEDRNHTTMHAFPMCRTCQAEYDDPTNRRYHAQTICCPDCGPRLRFLANDGRDDKSADPIAKAARCLTGGAVLALKGPGGYQLASDALNEDAVCRLRQSKRKEGKPFALMVPDVETALRLCEMDEDERALLQSPQHPIVSARRRADILPARLLPL